MRKIASVASKDVQDTPSTSWKDLPKSYAELSIQEKFILAGALLGGSALTILGISSMRDMPLEAARDAVASVAIVGGMIGLALGLAVNDDILGKKFALNVAKYTLKGALHSLATPTYILVAASGVMSAGVVHAAERSMNLFRGRQAPENTI